MRFGVTTSCEGVPGGFPVSLLEGSFSERIAKASKLGYDGVELLALRPAALDAGAIRTALRGAGVEAAAVATGALASIEGLTLLDPDPRVSGEASRRLMEMIEFAGELGAGVVTIGSFRGRVGDPRRREGASGRFVDLMGGAARRGFELGVALAVEPLNRYESDFLNTAQETRDLLGRIGGEGIGLLLDVYHMNIEEASPDEAVRIALAAGDLAHVHIGDSNRLPAGRGHIDFVSLFSILAEGGYRGYLSAEHWAKPTADQAAHETIDTLRGAMIAARPARPRPDGGGR